MSIQDDVSLQVVSDLDLVGQVRAGHDAAFGELVHRHSPVARRMASSYRREGDPENLVDEAFEKVFAAIRRGHGPTEGFRAYLLVTLRRLAAKHAERPADIRLEDLADTAVTATAPPPLAAEDRDLITRAFESLPEHWRAVLWQTAVEGRAPRDLAPALNMSANATAVLAYRAREKLRQAYLQAHLQAIPRPWCEPHRSRLGAYVRDGLGRRDRGATEIHLDVCGSCRSLVGELYDVNRMLVP